jgi:hypothetical protein
MSKWVMQSHFRHLRLNSFPMIQTNLQFEFFSPLKLPSKNSRVHWYSHSQNEISLGSVRVHSLPFFCTPRSIRCDFRVSFLARNLASLCFGHEPKVRVVTCLLYVTSIYPLQPLSPMIIFMLLLFHSNCPCILTIFLYYNNKYK